MEIVLEGWKRKESNERAANKLRKVKRFESLKNEKTKNRKEQPDTIGKAEFSRCRLPRLVIDQEGWRRSKAEERMNLENNEQAGKQQGGVQGFGQDEEGWEEWVSNLVEDELDIANAQKKSKGWN